MTIGDRTEAAIDWMNPLNKLKFQAAFKSKAPQVTLIGGQTFDLEYYKGKDKRAKVVVRPSKQHGYNPFVPMGRFDLKVACHHAWLD